MRLILGRSAENALDEVRDAAGTMHEVLRLSEYGGVNVGADGAVTLRGHDALVPPGWTPDAYVQWSIEYQQAIAATADMRCFTAAVVGDWNMGAQAFQMMGGAFDLLIADRRGCDVLRGAGFQHVREAQLWGFNPRLHRRLDGVERDIDILVVGNLNHHIQWERSAWLARIARLSRRHRVLVTTGVFDEQYTLLLNRARIVFNRSVRGEANMRAFEAPACAALMFYERDNPTIRDLFVDREECVLYADDDLEALLDYYLSHEPERERIALAGWRRVQAYTEEACFRQVLRIVDEEREAALAGSGRSCEARLHRRLTAAERRYAAAYQSMVCSPHRDHAGLDHALVELQEGDPRDSAIANFRGCLLAEQAEAATSPEARSALMAKALEWLRYAAMLASHGAVPYLNLGALYLTLGDWRNAEGALATAVEWLETATSAEQLSGPYYPRGYVRYDVELERAWAAGPVGSAAWMEEVRRVLLWYANEARCEAASLPGDPACAARAVEHARAACALLPDVAPSRLRLAVALAHTGRYAEAVPLFRDALAQAPFFTDLWNDYCRCLYECGTYEEGLRVAEDMSAVLAGCPPYAGKQPEVEAWRARFEIALHGQTERPAGDGAAAASRDQPELRGVVVGLPDWSRSDRWQPHVAALVRALTEGRASSLLLLVDERRYPALDPVLASLDALLESEDGETGIAGEIGLIHRTLDDATLAGYLSTADWLSLPEGADVPSGKPDGVAVAIFAANAAAAAAA